MARIMSRGCDVRNDVNTTFWDMPGSWIDAAIRQWESRGHQPGRIAPGVVPGAKAAHRMVSRGG